MNQPTGSKQGCRECGETEHHTFKCSLNAFYPTGRSPVLPSERSIASPLTLEEESEQRRSRALARRDGDYISDWNDDGWGFGG